MKPEREKEIRAVEAQCTGHSETDAVGLCLRDLLAEVDRLRRLPVIATCEDCSHVHTDRPQHRCVHPKARWRELRDEDFNKAPPEWCPWRGGER